MTSDLTHQCVTFRRDDLYWFTTQTWLKPYLHSQKAWLVREGIPEEAMFLVHEELDPPGEYRLLILTSAADTAMTALIERRAQAAKAQKEEEEARSLFPYPRKQEGGERQCKTEKDS